MRMEVQYEIKNNKLKKLVEEKAKEEHTTVGNMIWRYVNRGLMSDGIGEDVMNHTHSKEFSREVNETLGLD